MSNSGSISSLRGGAPVSAATLSSGRLLPVSESEAKINELRRNISPPNEEDKARTNVLAKKSIDISPSDQTTKKTASCFTKFLSFLTKTYHQIIACLKLLITTNRNYVYDDRDDNDLRANDGAVKKAELETGSKPKATARTLGDKQKAAEKFTQQTEWAKKHEARVANTAKRKPAIQAKSNKLAKSLEIKTRSDQLQGLSNITGNNCYMNAGLQLIQSFLRTDRAFLNLITTPLVREETQSLVDFENNMLHGWAPLTKETGESDDHFENRILFKWSFLLLMQAMSSSSEERTTEALRNFHQACFHLGLSEVFDFTVAKGQQDIGDFLTLWSTTLELSLLGIYTRSKCSYEGENLASEAQIAPMTLIQVPVINSNYVPLIHQIEVDCKKDVRAITQRYGTQIKVVAGERANKGLELKALNNQSKAIGSSPKKNQEKQELEKRKGEIRKEMAFLDREKRRLTKERDQEIRDRRAQASRDKNTFDAKQLLDHLVEDEQLEGIVEFNIDKQTFFLEGVIRELKLYPLHGQLPNGFFIHFKRFADPDSKINSPIDFSKAMKVNLKDYLAQEALDTLDLEDDECKYKLTSFSVHIGDKVGNKSSGHYVSYVKKDNHWYKCNDSVVSRIRRKDLPIEDAYVCYYQKRRPAKR
ncbi:MAG: ubiquitin carboxyl-terminal hydrolase [Parachlamydiaceae bacterium]